MLINRVEVLVSEKNPNYKSIYYSWNCMHDWRSLDKFDIMISRHDEYLSFDKKENITHTISISTKILDAKHVFALISKFEEDGGKYFFNPALLFNREMIEEECGEFKLSVIEYNSDIIVVDIYL